MIPLVLALVLQSPLPVPYPPPLPGDDRPHVAIVQSEGDENKVPHRGSGRRERRA